MEDYPVAVKTSEFGPDRKTGQKDGDDERFPIRLARARGTIDDHHTRVKPVSEERKVRVVEESERAGAGTIHIQILSHSVR